MAKKIYKKGSGKSGYPSDVSAEELVEEGVEEADRDQRIASADPDFEP